MDFREPAGADPGVTDLLRYRFGVQCPDDEGTVSDLVCDCHKRDLSLFLEMTEATSGDAVYSSWAGPLDKTSARSLRGSRPPVPGVDEKWALGELGRVPTSKLNRTEVPALTFSKQVVMNLLKRGGYRSIRHGLRELVHDIQGCWLWKD